MTSISISTALWWLAAVKVKEAPPLFLLSCFPIAAAQKEDGGLFFIDMTLFIPADDLIEKCFE